MAYGELEFLRWIFKRLNHSARVMVGPGDDCAVLSAAGSGMLLVTTDVLLEGSHFSLDIGPEAIGRKTIAVSLSDAAAMGVRPDAVVATVAFTRPTDRTFAESLINGMAAAAGEFDVDIVGGDVTSWEGPLALTSTVFALPSKGPVVRRGTAQPGDILYVTGSLGGSIAGRHYSFTPRVEEGVFLAQNGFATSMIDVSDGLARDLVNLLASTGTVIEAVRIPVSEDAKKLAAESGRSALSHALGDGEDFELLFAISPDDAERLEQKWPFDVKLTRIGEIKGTQILIRNPNGSEEPLKETGYEHAIE